MFQVVQGVDGRIRMMPQAEWLAARNEAHARTVAAQAAADAAHSRVAVLQARLSQLQSNVITNPLNPEPSSNDTADDPTCE